MPVTRRARPALAAIALLASVIIVLASVACSPTQNHNAANGNASPALPAANTNGVNANAAPAAARQPKPGTGSIEITSVPAGAGITLMPTGEDSAGAPLAYGPTPATINDLAPGKYALILHQTGYKEFRREIEIKAGDTLRVNAALKK